MIDAVFIYPKFGFPVLAEPVGICFILSYLKEKGFNVKIDEGFLRGDRLDEVVSRILRRDPLLVGITANSRPEFKSAKKFAKELRGKGYIGRIIIGGHAISLNARSFLQECRFVDAVAIGEGEITSEKILKKIKEGKNWKTVRGLIYINDNGEFVDTGNPEIIENVDDLPFMDRSILAVLLRRYGKHSSINATILNNRGCYGTCSFCSVKKLSGNAARCFRQRSMENLVDEILSIVKNYKVRDFYFCSPTFLPYKSFGEKHAEKFNMLLREKGLDISFFAYLRTDGISRKVVKELKMSGMKTLFLGIESFDDKVLRAMKKNATAKQNIEALEILHKAGYSCEYDSDFRLKIGLITFYPGINMDILKKHIKYVRKYRIPAKKLTYSYEVHDEKDLGFAGQANKKIYRKEIDEAGIEELRRAYIDFFSTLTPYLEKIRSLQKSCNNINEESNRSLYALLRSMNDLAYDLFEKLCECKTNSEMQALVRQSNDAVSDLAEKTDSEIIRIIDHNGKAMRKMYDYRLDRAVNNPQLN